MFFTDKNGINACQLGTGERIVLVSEAELEGVSAKECISVVFGETEKGNIGRCLPQYKNKKDFEAGVKIKLLFTDPKSIDVVINALRQAKKLMIEDG